MNRILIFSTLFCIFSSLHNSAYCEELFVIVPEARIIDAEKRLDSLFHETEQIKKDLDSVQNLDDKSIIASIFSTLASRIPVIIKNINNANKAISAFYTTNNALKQTQSATAANEMHNNLSEIESLLNILKKVTKTAVDQSTAEKSVLSQYMKTDPSNNGNVENSSAHSYQNITKFFNVVKKYLDIKRQSSQANTSKRKTAK